MSAPCPAKLDKGLAHFKRLKRSVEEASSLVAGDILLFLRVLYSDQSNWYRFVNSFDLLQPVILDGDTANRTEILSGVKCVKRIAPFPKASRQSLTLSDVIGLKILSIGSQEFTIKSILNASAYSGDVHPEPSADKIDLLLVKQRFLEAVPEFAQALIIELGSVLLASFKEVFSAWTESNMSSPDHFRQPQIVVAGRVVAPLFNNAYCQSPLRQSIGKGVRIIFDYCPTVSSTNGTVFALGHRTDNTLRIEINRSGDRLIFHIGDTQRPNALIWSKPGMLQSGFRWIEICTYSDGTVIAAVDGYQFGVGVLPSADIRSNCKMIMGSDLHGKNNNTFHHRELLIDFISPNRNIVGGNRFSCARRISYPIPAIVEQPNLMRRWTPPDIHNL